MIEVIPAIIPIDYFDLKRKMSAVNRFVPLVQIDVMDGVYAPYSSWPYRQKDLFFENICSQEEGFPFWDSLDFEVDMMVAKPEEKIDDWMSAGAKSVIIHLESSKNISLAIEKARAFEIKVGLALKPSTSNEKLYEFLKEADFVQFMGNNKIGYHGVSFDESVLEKIKELRERNKDIPIGVDIGVNKDTAPLIVKAGANRLISGSAIFESVDKKDTIERFRNLG